MARWGVEADDSAGRPLSQLPPGTLLLAIASAAAEDLAPVQLLALLKHPLVGGEGEDAAAGWMTSGCSTWRFVGRDRLAESPGSTRICRDFDKGGASGRGAASGQVWMVSRVDVGARCPIWPRPWSPRATPLAGDRAWSGAAGRSRGRLAVARSGAWVQRAACDGRATPSRSSGNCSKKSAFRPPYGGHPRVFIWGLLEARLQQADLMILGGLNEGVWPALPAPDPWLAPKIRANLGLPGLEFRVGLSAHDFASALGAPQVLITRARRDSRSPTVASRFG